MSYRAHICEMTRFTNVLLVSSRADDTVIFSFATGFCYCVTSNISAQYCFVILNQTAQTKQEKGNSRQSDSIKGLIHVFYNNSKAETKMKTSK